MTEAEWLACADPTPMLEFLRDRVSARKMRLFAVACCRRMWHLLADERSRKAIEFAESNADGVVPQWLCCEAADAAYEAADASGPDDNDPNEDEAWPERHHAAFLAAHVLDEPAFFYVDGYFRYSTVRRGYEEDAGLFRDIIGNPFRLASIQPEWLVLNDGTVVRLAQAIYEARAFDRLLILADALEDAGCDNADILEHCRQPGPHVRGCWVIDLLTGRI
jgi:hypothetical protein